MEKETKKEELDEQYPERLICTKCGEPTRDEGQDVSFCGDCAS